MKPFKMQRKEKLVTLQDAVKMIPSGCRLAVGGIHSHNAPCALVREIIRQRKKDFTLIPTNASGYQSDLLIGARCISRAYVSYIGLDYIGLAPNFRRLSEKGELNVEEMDEMGLLRGLKAGSAGLAFFPLPKGEKAVDVVKVQSMYREIEDPFTGSPVIVVPPLRADVAILHVRRADPFGNCEQVGSVEDLLARASDKVIVSTEEIVPPSYTTSSHENVTIPGFFVDAVVEAPYGAHPGDCHGKYHHDYEHLVEYARMGSKEEDFQEYLKRYVFGAKDHNEYLELVGRDRLNNLTYQ